jgi:formate hydrogenlyase subunit 6/NADH:ubiquinone oxidoreductase subunit I
LPQCVEVCPVDCIDKDPSHVEDHESLYQKFLKLTR